MSHPRRRGSPLPAVLAVLAVPAALAVAAVCAAAAPAPAPPPRAPGPRQAPGARQAPGGLRVAARWELAVPGGVLAIPCGPGVAVNGRLALVTAWAPPPAGTMALDAHLWLVRLGDPAVSYIHPRLGGDKRLERATLLAAWPVRADRILALFSLRDGVGIVAVSADGAARLLAVAKRPAGDLEVRRLVALRDGSFVAAGRAQAAPFAFRFRDDGEVLWSQVRQDVTRGIWTDVLERPDGSLALVGQIAGAGDAKAGGAAATPADAGGAKAGAGADASASVVAEIDAHGNVAREERVAAEQAIVVGPPESPLLLARDPQAPTWGLRPLAGSGAGQAAAVPLAGELRPGGWLTRSAHTAGGAAVLSEELPELRADVAMVRADGSVLRSEPIAGVIAAPSGLLAAGAGETALALFAGVPRPRTGGGVEGEPVLVWLTADR